MAAGEARSWHILAFSCFDVISSYFKRHDYMHVLTDTHACTYTSVFKQIER